MTAIMQVGLPLERERATVVAFAPKEDGWIVLCIRWNDFMPYVVWDAVPADSSGGFNFSNGGYSQGFGEAVYQYAHRGGDVSVVNEEEEEAI